jgi:hypothetical protein
MSHDLMNEKQQAHDLIDRLPPAQLAAVTGLLKAMLDPVSRWCNPQFGHAATPLLVGSRQSHLTRGGWEGSGVEAGVGARRRARRVLGDGSPAAGKWRLDWRQRGEGLPGGRVARGELEGG